MNWFQKRWQNITNLASDAKDAAGTVGRSYAIAWQGVARGVASGGASLGDLAVNTGYNWTSRHAINLFKKDDLQAYNTNWADNAAEAVTFIRAENDWERGLMTGGQVVGEIGSFVAVTVATGGVGGAAVGGSIAATRGTAIGARALNGGARLLDTAQKVPLAGKLASAGAKALRYDGTALDAGIKIAGATGSFMNPFAGSSRAARAFSGSVEGGFGLWRGHDLWKTDAESQELAKEFGEQAANGLVEAGIAEQERIQNITAMFGSELEDITRKFGNGGLTAEQSQALVDRIDEIEAGNQILSRLVHEQLPQGQRNDLHAQVNGYLSNEQKQELGATIESNNISSSYVDGFGAAAQGQAGPVQPTPPKTEQPAETLEIK